MRSGRRVVRRTGVLSGVWHFRRILLGTVTAAAVAILVASIGTTVVVALDEYLDPTFGTGGKVTTDFGADDRAFAVVLQPDGKLVTAGGSAGNFLLARYLPDGSLDATFGAGGHVTTDFGGLGDSADALIQQPDGKLVAAGVASKNACCPDYGDFGLVRYLPDGSLDSTFGVGGKVTTNFNAAYLDSVSALVLQPDGKLVALSGGPFGPVFLLSRYNSDGSLDATFGAGGKVTDVGGGGASLVLQPDGTLVAAGMGAPGDFLLTRYLPDGSLDTTFGTGGRVTTDFGGTEAASALVLQPDGKLVAAGGFPTLLGNPPFLPTGVENFLLARYNPDGTLDPTFGTGGKVTTDFFFGSIEWAHALVLQPDGRLVAAGVTASLFSGGVSQFALARYNPDGSLDGTFGSFGKVTTGFAGHAFANALVLQPDGRLVAAGSAVDGDFALARYMPGGGACVVNTLAAASDQQLAMDDTAAKSGTLSGPVADGAKSAGRGTQLDPAAFRRLRDQVLVRSKAGRRYTALYAAHSPEVVGLMFTDSALRGAILDGLLLWQASVAAIADGRGAAVTVTADQARAVDLVLDRLAKAGSPGLRKAIEEERRAHTPGFNLAQVVLREIGREDNRR